MARIPLCVILMALSSVVLAQEKPEHRTIAVTGQGEVQATPDRAQVSFAVETTASKAADAAAENAKRSAAVVAAVKPLLSSGGSVGTARYTIEPRYEPEVKGVSLGREPRITGYVVRNQVEVSEAPADKAGALIDAAVGAGANRVEGLSFSFARRDELLSAALEKAGAAAHARAESVARGLGVRLKGVLTASTTSGPVFAPRQFRAVAAESMAAPTPIEPGEEAVSATLQVTYEIE
jgi:uncharacterized protein YggE